MKLLVDMNLSPRWIHFLAASQIEAMHWSTVGPVKATDTEIMTYARDHGFVVLTHDLDFSAPPGGYRWNQTQRRANPIR